jgi:hypothetical protein
MVQLTGWCCRQRRFGFRHTIARMGEIFAISCFYAGATIQGCFAYAKGFLLLLCLLAKLLYFPRYLPLNLSSL